MRCSIASLAVLVGIALLTAATARAETLIDDFSSDHPAFGEQNIHGNGVFDVVIGGAGIAESRDGLGQASPIGDMTTLPGSVAGGQFVINNLDGPFHTLFLQWDLHGDNSLGMFPSMAGAPYDMTGITEFRIDASGLVGTDLQWFVSVADGLGTTAGSFSEPLVNGVNTIAYNFGSLQFIDYSAVLALQIGVINFSSSPASINLDNFRVDVDLVPEPGCATLAIAAAALLVRRRAKGISG